MGLQPAIRHPALGRKAYLFVASRAGGRRAAILFSLTASCKANQVEPWAYLRDLFSRLPALLSDSPDELDLLLRCEESPPVDIHLI